jgi:hypothetical protein
LHGAAVLSCVIDKTLLELANVLEGICQLPWHLFLDASNSDFLKALKSVGKQASTIEMKSREKFCGHRT